MKVISRLFLLLIYAFLYVPIIVLIIYSFNNSQYSMLWHGFTWAWYQQLSSDSDLISSAVNSIALGVSASSIATLLGTLCAVSLYRYNFKGQKLLYFTVFLLILMPDIVIGTSLLILFSTANFELGFFSLLIAHITLCLPFVVIVIYSRLTTVDENIFEAALDLGATNSIIFKRILIPLLTPGLIAAWLLSFTLSLDDVIISYFVSGPNFQILPLQIFSMVKLGVDPEINALTSIIFAITVLFVLISHFSLRKK